MLGPLLFVYRGFLVMFFVLQNKICNNKKSSKKVFFAKKLFTERKFEKCCEAKKRCTGVILLGAEKKFQWEKSKLKVGHSYKKNNLNHTSETQKSVFFNFVFWEVFLMQSLPTANFSLVFELLKFKLS